MRPSVLALLLSVSVATACLVNTRSGDLACSMTSDCTSPRVCEGGYCVIDENACPAVCNGGCSTDGTCNINGAGGDSITCPSGKTCNIDCIGDNACGNITCGIGDCIITCSGTNACGDVACGNHGAGRCRVECAGTNACGDVACSNACDCVVDGCTTSGCGTLTCPRLNGTTYCTETGANGPPCTDTTSGCSC